MCVILLWEWEVGYTVGGYLLGCCNARRFVCARVLEEHTASICSIGAAEHKNPENNRIFLHRSENLISGFKLS
jgi:hypothetical protein